MSPWRSGSGETRAMVRPVSHHRLVDQISESCSASGKRRPLSTSAMRPGFTRKAAAILWMASPSLRRFHTSMASGSVSGGDIGAERGAFGRDCDLPLRPGPAGSESRSVEVGAEGGFSLRGDKDIGSLSIRKAACQTRKNHYFINVVVKVRATKAAVIWLRRAAPASAALLVWRAFDGVGRPVCQEKFGWRGLPTAHLKLITGDRSLGRRYHCVAGWAATLKVSLGRPGRTAFAVFRPASTSCARGRMRGAR